jgi:hypothetical protein
MIRAAVLLTASAIIAALPGCGYSTGNLMPEGVNSIAVPMAGNETFYRGDEFVYTRYLTLEIIRKTHVQVRECKNADAILHAKLLRMRRIPLVEGKDDVVLEEGLLGAVEVTLTDRRSGRIIMNFTVERRAEGLSGRGEFLTFERDRLMRELAEDSAIRLQDQSFLNARGYGIPCRTMPSYMTAPAPAPESRPE